MELSYPVPIYLPRRRRIVTPGEWLREKLEEQRRARDEAITRIALDADLGINMVGSGGTTHTLTTTDDAAAGTRVWLCGGHWLPTTLNTVTDAGPGLTWVIDVQGNNNPSCWIVTADAPAGMASGTVITMTFSASTDARSCGAFSMSGVTGGASGYLDSTPPATATASGGSTWVSPSETTTAADCVLVSCLISDGVNGMSSATTTGVEVHDQNQPLSNFHLLTSYLIVSLAGTYNTAGTWTGGPAGDTRKAIAAYKAVPGVAPALAARDDRRGFGPF